MPLLTIRIQLAPDGSPRDVEVLAPDGTVVGELAVSELDLHWTTDRPRPSAAVTLLNIELVPEVS